MQSLAGRYGVFILPDLATARRAQALAKESPQAPDWMVGAPAIPIACQSIALFPGRMIEGILGELRRYVGYDFQMQTLVVCGKRAFCWEAVSDDLLRQMQQSVQARLSRYRDASGNVIGEKGRLDLGDYDLANLVKHGYPFLGRFPMWLAYRERGFEAAPSKATCKTTIRDIVFAELGDGLVAGKLFQQTETP